MGTGSAVQGADRVVDGGVGYVAEDERLVEGG